MIAVQTFQGTGQSSPKYQPSTKAVQFDNQNIQPKSENRILFARCIERLDKTELFGQAQPLRMPCKHHPNEFQYIS
jgi:hypothetical protein